MHADTPARPDPGEAQTILLEEIRLRRAQIGVGIGERQGGEDLPARYLATAGACYAEHIATGGGCHAPSPRRWPFSEAAWTPSDSPLSDAITSAAFLLAYGERLIADAARIA